MAMTPGLSCFKGGREQVPALYANTENWPLFDTSLVPKESKPRFDALQKAVNKYLDWAPTKEVEKAAKMSIDRFLRIFVRCGVVLPDGSIVGWRALVKGTAVAPPVRKAPLAAPIGGKAGWGGAFSQLLADKPKIVHDLTLYLNGRGIHSLRPNRVEFRAIRKKFLKICEEHGIGQDEYPRNTREGGRKALRRWIDTVYMSENANRFIALQEGEDAAGLHAYAGGDGQAEMPAAPYSVWMLDEVTIDLNARYELPNASGDWEELDLARFFQIRLIDRGGATLATRCVFAAQANGDDIATVFWDALNGPPEVPQVLEGETLLEGAGYPSKMIDKLRFAVPQVILLDRALSHLKGHVQYIATILFGARVVLGPPKTPRERAEVESRFSAQARRVLHKLPGTTGSGPKDPVRKRAEVPLEGRVRAEAVEQVLDAYARNENITPAAASFNIAPLVRLRRQLESGALQPLYLSPEKRKPFFFSQPLRVTVKLDARPFVNYLYMRYSSDQLGKDYGMVEKTLWLRADLRNLRTVLLFREDGSLYGPVQVLGKWGTFPHDVRLRRLFGRLKREGELGPRADDEPLEAIFAHLRKGAPANRKKALQLTYLVEYLQRNGVTVGPRLAHGIWEWAQLQAAAEQAAVLPIKSMPAPIEPANEGTRPEQAPPRQKFQVVAPAPQGRVPAAAPPAVPVYTPRRSVSR